MLFKASETWPKTTEDHGHDLAHPTSSVSFPCFKVYPLLSYSRRMSKLPYLFFQGWTKKAERIQCPAPLPEEPAIPLLMKMLVLVPYQAQEKKSKGTRGGLRRKGVSDVTPEDAEMHSTAEDDEEEEKTRPSPPTRGEEEEGLHTWGGRGVQEGENFPSGQLRSGHQHQPGVGAQGQALGQIVSVRTW